MFCILVGLYVSVSCGCLDLLRPMIRNVVRQSLSLSRCCAVQKRLNGSSKTLGYPLHRVLDGTSRYSLRRGGERLKERGKVWSL